MTALFILAIFLPLGYSQWQGLVWVWVANGRVWCGSGSTLRQQKKSDNRYKCLTNSHNIKRAKNITNKSCKCPILEIFITLAKTNVQFF